MKYECGFEFFCQCGYKVSFYELGEVNGLFGRIQQSKNGIGEQKCPQCGRWLNKNEEKE